MTQPQPDKELLDNWQKLVDANQVAQPKGAAQTAEERLDAERDAANVEYGFAACWWRDKAINLQKQLDAASRFSRSDDRLTLAVEQLRKANEEIGVLRQHCIELSGERSEREQAAPKPIF